MKATLFIFLFWVSSVCAEGFNDNFDTKPLDLEWGSSIQQVKEAYPGGLVWPSHNNEVEVNYSLSSESKIYWGGIPAKNVIISFTPENKLSTVYVLFDYVDHQEVSRRSVEIFGVIDRVQEKDGLRKVAWYSPHGVEKKLFVNSAPHVEYVYFVAQKK
ncbi:MAG: hypothetical protein AAGC78_01125 [Cellvibrio sp.]|uniref:hypothetical protein n=1 Tax=Cellvibrio sp. TaxID=1965322 RepID=UPI0031A937BB